MYKPKIYVLLADDNSRRILTQFDRVLGSDTIWQDAVTGQVWRGSHRLPCLRPLEEEVLKQFLAHPYYRYTYTELIRAVWSKESQKGGVSTECVYKLVSDLRKKVESNPEKPCYIQTWRGRPEGGYQFFPHGQRDPAYTVNPLGK